MKRTAAICIFLAINIMAYSRKDYLSDTTQKQTQFYPVISKSVVCGYQGIIELGSSLGIGKYGMNNIRLNFINSLNYNPYFSFGLGIGLRYYSNIHESYSTVNSSVLIPIFLNLRTNLLNGKISPYLALGVGGTFFVEPLLKSSKLYTGLLEGVGFLLNPSAGVSFKISEKCAINTGIAYERQKMNFHLYPNPETKECVGSLSFNCGISF